MESAAPHIPIPQTMEELGIRRSLLEDLAVKFLYLEGEMTVRELARKMRISTGVIKDVFDYLRKEQFIEIKGMAAGDFRVTTTMAGKERALVLLSQSHYAGPTPVSYQEYITRVHAQSVRDADVHPEDVERAFKHLVMTEGTLTQLGTAVVSGTSIVLYGPTGTGKTTIADALPGIYRDHAWIPHAVEVDGQIITVYDPISHQKVEQTGGEQSDGRWVLCSRPRVMVGGELTIEMLDLQFNPVTRFYSAPVQMKANNGVLVIDDFGRQRIRPEELLNRWIIPLDRRIDFLTLAGGRKLEIPFDLFVVFATNIDPLQLADEAFLRRIHNKIKVENMSRAQFHEIFRNLCAQHELAYDSTVVDHVIAMLEKDFNQPLRACYPRDIINQIRWAAQYVGKKPLLDRDTVAQACRNYFLVPTSAA
jgi:predicted ATPase with chaperone activity